MKKTENHNFTEGEILRPIVRFSLPVLAALFLQVPFLQRMRKWRLLAEIT